VAWACLWRIYRVATAQNSLVLKGFLSDPVQLRRATLYPAELRVRGGSFSRLAGPRQRPASAKAGKEQGPEGKGHTFESCRGRQGSTCRACRDCGGSIRLNAPTGDGRSMVHSLAGCPGVMMDFSTICGFEGHPFLLGNGYRISDYRLAES
jgi:hypothetical protein